MLKGMGFQQRDGACGPASLKIVLNFLGIKVTEKQLMKEKMLKTFQERKVQQGENNSHFGKIWIFSIEEKRNIIICPEEFINYEKFGCKKGRKIKF